jgi:hypothetical protein
MTAQLSTLGLSDVRYNVVRFGAKRVLGGVGYGSAPKMDGGGPPDALPLE